MKLSEFKKSIAEVNELKFQKLDKSYVPAHFHITEIGQIDKKYIDCGGSIRFESVISVQLWESIDLWHRLEPKKLLDIIELSEKKLAIGDYEIELEYQGTTIEKFHLEFENGVFKLLATHTDCLAQDRCGIPNVKITNIKTQNSCTPGSGCC